MSSKVRSMARGIAKTAMKEQGMKLFKQYAPVEGKVQKFGKERMDLIQKSVFARQWRDYC